jgi:hypothetical protein
MLRNTCPIRHRFWVTALETSGLNFCVLVRSCDGAFRTSQHGTPTVSTFGSCHFRQHISDNSVMKWQDILTRRNPICISSMAFVMEMPELQRERQPNRRVCKGASQSARNRSIHVTTIWWQRQTQYAERRGHISNKPLSDCSCMSTA